jgi:SAM-dependent methyltransferase
MSDAGASRLPDETSIPPDVYAAWRGSTLGRITEQLEVDLVLELAGPLEGKRVLDVGTGDGTYAIAAAGRHKRASVVGIDVSSAMVTAARRRADEAGVDLELRSGSAESLPFEGASFDLVLAVTLLCFVQEPTRAVSEMARVLAPGGRLVLADLGRFSTWAAWRAVRGLLGSRTWRGKRFWTLDMLEDLVGGAGLDLEQARGAIYYPPVGFVARLARPIDARLGHVAPGLGAFIAVTARKLERNA